ncbi:Na+/H+ antiporter subunit B [Roseibium limicola]|uniref:Na+/H+ antiporter subunit B n=1 Tax=Roseibium limicola TaxID=2816037 RepID=A0A939EN65_9HYPH|nr:Na+/H+ antiporter subunit B [Roseibium limicola]MBO0345240.1 Na+/H+ antiporter subunit B [Roseibium limicola]
MRTIIFRTIAPYLTALMILFSIFVLLRGHNEPGGGFIGGLIAASALAIYGIACGVTSVRRAIRVHPMSLAAFGLLIATLAGLPSLFFKQTFMTTQFITLHAFGTEIDLMTPMLFDLGVYFVVVGAISSIALALEERESD